MTAEKPSTKSEKPSTRAEKPPSALLRIVNVLVVVVW
jgi:hypothetical protein